MGYKVEIPDENLTHDMLALQIQNEDAVNHPEKVVTLLVNAAENIQIERSKIC